VNNFTKWYQSLLFPYVLEFELVSRYRSDNTSHSSYGIISRPCDTKKDWCSSVRPPEGWRGSRYAPQKDSVDDVRTWCWHIDMSFSDMTEFSLMYLLISETARGKSG
jgi:hypothetical protein